MDSGTRLAVDRTRLAYERTMMAWVRTGTSLITFGFSIYKFFQVERAVQLAPRSGQLLGPANFAVLMIAIGLVALLLATLENRRDLNRLKVDFPDMHFHGPWREYLPLWSQFWELWH